MGCVVGLKLLFWNIYKGRALPYLQAATLETGADVIIVSECSGQASDVVSVLNAGINSNTFAESALNNNSIKCFYKTMSCKLAAAEDDPPRVTIRECRPVGEKPILIAAAHLPSKLHAENDEQYEAAREFSSLIRRAERKAGHSRTIAIGDFNMDPYALGMMAFDGMHGNAHLAEVLQRRSRTRKTNTREFFYNPSWSRLGDETLGPAGTYSSSRGGLTVSKWRHFDQALIRPDLLAAYKRGGYEIRTKIGSISLVTSNSVNKKYSDHLPILLNLEL